MNKTPKILIIIGSTRPGRAGRAIANWFYDQTNQQHDAAFELVDLADWQLPMFDEPVPPKAHMYQHDHTKRWSAKIAEADGYVLVTPEYNHGYPASLKNALDFLYHEWGDKPVALVSYGMGGGRLAAQQLRQVLEELRMRALDEQLSIFFEPGLFDERHQLNPEGLTKYAESAQALIAQLAKDTIQKEKANETI